jgi:arginase family enzyme
MRAVLLELDHALERQTMLADAVARGRGQVIDARDLGPRLRLWSLPAPLTELRRRLAAALPPEAGPQLVFAGSGDFHHVTPLLVERALAGMGEPVTIVHFDNHPDWARFAPGWHCGSWVGRAARLEGVRKVVTVGVTSDDIAPRKAREGDLALVADGRLELFAWSGPEAAAPLSLGGGRWPTVAGLGEDDFLDRLDIAVPAGAVYVTIDKDVLRPQDAVTNWDQGQASLEFVEAAVRRVACGRRVVGADVVGDWSAPAYGAGPLAWLKHAEALLDQPRARPEAAALAVNERANLRLLQLFEGVAS